MLPSVVACNLELLHDVQCYQQLLHVAVLLHVT